MATSTAGPTAKSTYIAIMEEVKQRLDAIHTASASCREKTYPHPEYMGVEFCILQLRYICELVGLACFVAQYGISETRALSKGEGNTYQPSKLLAMLDKLNANAYPHPVRLVCRPGSSPDLIDRPEEEFLTRGEMKDLWEQCSRHLHRGYIKEFVPYQHREYPGFFIIPATRKISWLLDRHIIHIPGGEPEQALVSMAGDDQGSVKWQDMVADMGQR